MTTREAIELVAKQLKSEPVVCTTGYTCRDVQAVADRPENFYMIGSMGLAASIGLGVAQVQPQKKVVVFDGDGALLMGLGNLALTGTLKPKNFIHVVFDNEVFASTGNQPTHSSAVDLDALAKASGYASVQRVQTPDEVKAAWAQAQSAAGPAFILIKCEPNMGPPKERIRWSPEEMTQRFSHALRG